MYVQFGTCGSALRKSKVRTTSTAPLDSNVTCWLFTLCFSLSLDPLLAYVTFLLSPSLSESVQLHLEELVRAAICIACTSSAWWWKVSCMEEHLVFLPSRAHSFGRRLWEPPCFIWEPLSSHPSSCPCFHFGMEFLLALLSILLICY